MKLNQNSIADLREKLMSTRQVVCTGNPNRPFTLASGFKKIFPDAIFLCRDTGWDLKSISPEHRADLKKIFKQCNTFLNCSYIAPGVLSELLEICHESVKFCDVVNVGSTHEYDGLGHEDYQISKLNLRNQSLRYNSFRFKTCHYILGGIKKDHSDKTKDWLDVDLICQSIIDIWRKPYHTPMIVIDQFKEPW